MISYNGNMLILLAQFIIDRTKLNYVALLSRRLAFVVVSFHDKALDRSG